MLEKWRSQNQSHQTSCLPRCFSAAGRGYSGFSYEPAGLNAWAERTCASGLVSVVAVLSYAEWGGVDRFWRSAGVDPRLALGASASPPGSAATKVHVMVGLIVTVLAARGALEGALATTGRWTT